MANQNRYFFIAWSAQNYNANGEGNITVEAKRFPSNKELRKVVSDQNIYKTEDIVITSMFEFKNKQDYENYIQK